MDSLHAGIFYNRTAYSEKGLAKERNELLQSMRAIINDLASRVARKITATAPMVGCHELTLEIYRIIPIAAALTNEVE